MIEVNKMVPKCSRCRLEFHVQEFFLTTDKCLIFSGLCYHCQQKITLTIPLADLAANCPTNSDYTIKDISDLHLMGISVPREPPLLLPSLSTS